MDKCYRVLKRWRSGDIKELELISRSAKTAIVKGTYCYPDIERRMRIETEVHLIVFSAEEAKKVAKDMIEKRISVYEKSIKDLKSEEIKISQ